MNRLSVSCTRSGVASNSALKAGSAGRLISMASAVSAVIAPSSTTSMRDSERIMAAAVIRRSGILEAQHAAVDVVGEKLGITGPVDHRLEDLLAVLEVSRGEGAACRQNLDVAAADLGESKELERFQQHHQIVGRQMLA